MKLTAKLKNVASRLKAKRVKYRRPPKWAKPVKKNSWRRKLKAFDLTLNLRQRERATPLVIDFTDRVCIPPFKLLATTVVYTLFVTLLPGKRTLSI